MTTIIRRANAKGGSDTDSGPQAVAWTSSNESCSQCGGSSTRYKPLLSVLWQASMVGLKIRNLHHHNPNNWWDWAQREYGDEWATSMGHYISRCYKQVAQRWPRKEEILLTQSSSANQVRLNGTNIRWKCYFGVSRKHTSSLPISFANMDGTRGCSNLLKVLKGDEQKNCFMDGQANQKHWHCSCPSVWPRWSRWQHDKQHDSSGHTWTVGRQVQVREN